MTCELCNCRFWRERVTDSLVFDRICDICTRKVYAGLNAGRYTLGVEVQSQEDWTENCDDIAVHHEVAILLFPKDGDYWDGQLIGSASFSSERAAEDWAHKLLSRFKDKIERLD